MRRFLHLFEGVPKTESIIISNLKIKFAFRWCILLNILEVRSFFPHPSPKHHKSKVRDFVVNWRGFISLYIFIQVVANWSAFPDAIEQIYICISWIYIWPPSKSCQMALISFNFDRAEFKVKFHSHVQLCFSISLYKCKFVTKSKIPQFQQRSAKENRLNFARLHAK